ncbi:MAG: hypothetical protein COB76_02435 [Alphaproteobacteria bacterium]|nr:MAG: hypothetical protein COB76_02435 [Alphaproteobacteria bacterium]
MMMNRRWVLHLRNETTFRTRIITHIILLSNDLKVINSDNRSILFFILSIFFIMGRKLTIQKNHNIWMEGRELELQRHFVEQISVC